MHGVHGAGWPTEQPKCSCSGSAALPTDDGCFGVCAGRACRAHRDLRAALAILSMVAATRPEAFAEQHVEMLLKFGFSRRQCDALITRHACITLTRLAANLKTGWVGGRAAAVPWAPVCSQRRVVCVTGGCVCCWNMQPECHIRHIFFLRR